METNLEPITNSNKIIITCNLEIIRAQITHIIAYFVETQFPFGQ